MRIAALYDIHGNLPALVAVLEEVAREGVDLVVMGGDLVPGPMPGACMEVLESSGLPVTCLRGNGEADVAAVARGEVPRRVPEAFLPILRWSAQALGSELAGACGAWFATLGAVADGIGDVLFCHATPEEDNAIVTVETPEAVVLQRMRGAGTATVVCGHTHMAFDRQVGPLRVINPGSVGMPFGDTAAHWALLGPSVELRRTVYDVEDAMRRIQESGYPGADLMDLADPPSARRMLAVFEG